MTNKHPNVTAPTLNLNGTSGEALMQELRTAGEAVRTAIEAVGAMTVHGRDFQTAEIGAYNQARFEQKARLEKLRSVLDEIRCLQENVYEQMQSRRRTV
jgi:hypothetical protein